MHHLNAVEFEKDGESRVTAVKILHDVSCEHIKTLKAGTFAISSLCKVRPASKKDVNECLRCFEKQGHFNVCLHEECENPLFCHNSNSTINAVKHQEGHHPSVREKAKEKAQETKQAAETKDDSISRMEDFYPAQGPSVEDRVFAYSMDILLQAPGTPLRFVSTEGFKNLVSLIPNAPTVNEKNVCLMGFVIKPVKGNDLIHLCHSCAITFFSAVKSSRNFSKGL